MGVLKLDVEAHELHWEVFFFEANPRIFDCLLRRALKLIVFSPQPTAYALRRYSFLTTCGWLSDAQVGAHVTHHLVHIGEALPTGRETYVDRGVLQPVP